MEIFLIVLLASAAPIINAAGTCSDIDTSACVRMQANQPNLCSSDLGNTACPSFCGICGTTDPPTTVMPLVMSTLAPCEDIDTHACMLMHHTRPDLCQDDSLAYAACKRYCGKCPVECFSCSDLMTDMAHCNNLTMCNLNEACYQMEVFDFDNHHGFQAGCISKNLCIPHGGGQQIFGRSSSTVHTKCCDTDRCNGDIITTTTPMTTTTTRHHNLHCVDKAPARICSELRACTSHPTDCQRTCGLCYGFYE